MNRSTLVLLAVAVFSLSACTEYVPYMSNSGTMLSPQLPPDKYQILGNAEATACASYIFGFPTGGSNLNQTAVNNAVKSKNGDFFVQSTADIRLNYFPSTLFALYLERCVTVQGLVLKFK